MGPSGRSPNDRKRVRGRRARRALAAALADLLDAREPAGWRPVASLLRCWVGRRRLRRRACSASSTGVDAAVASRLRLWIDPPPHPMRPGALPCSPDAVRAAPQRRPCHSLGVPHLTLDGGADEPSLPARTVVQPFPLDDYQAPASRPNPLHDLQRADFRIGGWLADTAPQGLRPAVRLATRALRAARAARRGGACGARGRDPAKGPVGDAPRRVFPRACSACWSFPPGRCAQEHDVRREAAGVGLAAATAPLKSQDVRLLSLGGGDLRGFPRPPRRRSAAPARSTTVDGAVLRPPRRRRPPSRSVSDEGSASSALEGPVTCARSTQERAWSRSRPTPPPRPGARVELESTPRCTGPSSARPTARPARPHGRRRGDGSEPSQGRAAAAGSTSPSFGRRARAGSRWLYDDDGRWSVGVGTIA